MTTMEKMARTILIYDHNKLYQYRIRYIIIIPNAKYKLFLSVFDFIAIIYINQRTINNYF